MGFLNDNLTFTDVLHACAYMCTMQCPQGTEEGMEAPGRELQMVVSPVWALGTELGSSGRPGNDLNYRTIYPACLPRLSILS